MVGQKNTQMNSKVMAQYICKYGGSVAEWLACWTQALDGPGSNRSHDVVG